MLEKLELTEEQQARVQDQGDVIEITLAEPIKYFHSKLDGERTLTSLQLVKRVKGKHLKAMDQAGSGEIAQSLALVAAIAGVPARAIDELDLVDFELVMQVIEPFLPKRPATGLASSGQ